MNFIKLVFNKIQQLFGADNVDTKDKCREGIVDSDDADYILIDIIYAI